MSSDLQQRFRELALGENIYVGGKLATQNDLSGLFFARSVALYLKEGGRIAFVMPLAAMSRGQFEAFRTGRFYTKKVQFVDAWCLAMTSSRFFRFRLVSFSRRLIGDLDVGCQTRCDAT